jgi:hypothetical protein
MGKHAKKDIYGLRDQGATSVKQALIRHSERADRGSTRPFARLVKNGLKQDSRVFGEQLSFDFGDSDVTTKKIQT